MAHPIRIAPSLLAADFARLGEEIRRVEEAGADWHHVDVMDGHFVPNLTLGPPAVAAMKRVATRPLDVHLMIEEPAAWAEHYAEAGADILTFHLEATPDLARTLDAFRGTGRKVGIAVNPDRPVEPLRPFLDRVDLVLVMSVFPGFGGQRFQPEVLEKVRQLRDWGYDGDVEVDGGVTAENAAACRDAGASVLVAGTFVFRSPDLGEAIRALRGVGAEASLG